MMAEPIDDFAKRIMERTRERREMLAKKMADTSPRRKRSSPLSNSQLQNITSTSQQITQESDSPNKRTCVRTSERSVHDDTPAVRGVKSRMEALAERRKQWFNGEGENDENMDVNGTSQGERLIQPVFDEVDGDQATEKPARKTRLAELAKSISSWEDDLSHPTIRQEEKPKKKVWQRPKCEDYPNPAARPAHSKREEEEGPAPAKPPRTYEHEADVSRESSQAPVGSKFVSPTRKPLEDALSPPKADRASRSPKKAVSSITVMLNHGGTASSSVTSVRERSPYRSTSASTVREPSPYRAPGAATVREPSPYRNSSSRLRDASPAKPVSSVQVASPGKVVSSVRAPSPGVRAPSPGRSIVGNSVPKPYASPAKAQLVTSTATLKTDTVHATSLPAAVSPMKASAPAGKPTSSRRSDVHEPTKKPVADRLQAWRQRTDGVPAPRTTASWQNKSHTGVDRPQAKGVSAVLEQSMLHDDDPLNMSIHSRMNVWETKIHETEQEKEEAAKGQKEILATRANVRHPSGNARANNRPQENSPVWAQQTAPTSSVGNKSPLSKSPKIASPSKVGMATRALHDRLEAFQNNWQSNEIAEKIRQQKEKDMAVLQNRWKTGIHECEGERSEGAAGQPAEQSSGSQTMPQAAPQGAPPAPPPPSVGSKSPHKPGGKPMTESREQHRNAMRKVLPNGDGATHTDTLPAPQNFEEKLQMMGFNVESDKEHNHKATCDLTPYRERDRRAREEAATGAGVAARDATPARGRTPCVTVEERRITEVRFDDEQRDSVVRSKSTQPVVTSAAVFTPSKPSTAYAQRNAAGKTPSIYSLIKKNAGITGGFKPAGTASGVTATPDVLKRNPTGRKDSFSDDSFESECPPDTEEEEALVGVRKSVTFGGSQASVYSEVSETTSQLSESQTDTQSETYSETEDTGARNTEDYSSDEESYDSEEEEGNVSELLDEALSDGDSETQPAARAPEPAPVARRSKYADPAARPPRPTTLPPKDSDVESSSGGDYYSTRANRNSAPSQSAKRVKFAPEYPSSTSTAASSTYSSSATESESEDKTPAYSIDMYRRSKSKINAPVPKMTIVRHSDAHRKEMQEKQDPLPYTPTKSAKERLQELQDAVTQENNVIMQTSNALNLCCGTNSTFAGSQEAVECHKLLLIACKKREAYISEMHKLRQGRAELHVGPQGSLTISDIRLPLKQDFMHRMGGHQDFSSYYFLLLVRHGDHVVFTQMKGTHDEMVKGTLDVLSKGTLDIPNMIKFNDISQDFRLELEVYGMSVIREDPSAKSSKKKKGLTPKKLLKGGRGGLAASPGGPTAVRSTNFVLVGHMILDARALNKTHFTLDGVPYLSPLHGTVHLRLRCVIENTVEERGFLTMFEDVSGFGAWHRRWFVLKNSHLSYWKYPDDERSKEPMGYMELKQVVTDQVGLIPRDICARPNTFELITVRRQTRGEHDTLTSRCYNTMTTTKHWLSADTKEERMLWCNRLNEALVNIRTWHADALRPIKQKDFVQPYNPYPSKSDQRSCVIPFNPHDQQSAV